MVIGKSLVKEGYTIYKNTNEEMVKQIKNFKIPKENFNYLRYLNSNIVQVLNEKQNLCLDDKNEYFIVSNESIEECLKQNLLQEINDKFSVVDAINESFGNIYDAVGFKQIKFHMNKEGKYDDICKTGYCEIGYKFSTYSGITLQKATDEWSSIAFCHLNEDGNIVNRDHNIDLTKYLENKPLTKKDMIEQVMEKIPDITYKKYGNKWFADKFAFVFNSLKEDTFILSKLEFKGNDKYGDRYSGVEKLPKKTTDVDRNDILQKILPIINELDWGEKVDLIEYFTFASEVQAINQVPTKRVQETKINEEEYEVFDLTDDEEVLGDADLIESLKNIENSIDIPNNEEDVKNWLEDELENYDLPSFSFSKGEKQPNNSKFKGLVKMPHDCNFTFRVAEGDASEITWSHSIYYTDVIDLELVH